MKIRLSLVLCATFVFATAAPAEIPPQAQALIDKHVAWLGGWTALDGLRDLTLEGTIEVAGLTGTVSSARARRRPQRMEYDLKVVKGIECLDGASRLGAQRQRPGRGPRRWTRRPS